jgi:exonuclease SbcC
LKEQNRQIDQDKKEQAKVLKEIETLQLEHKRITDWLLSHAADEQLAGQLAGIREQFSQLQQLAAELAEKQRQAAAAEKRLDQAKKQQTATEKAVTLALQAQEKDQENSRRQQERLAEILAGRTLRDLHREHEEKWQSLVLLRTIASLEDERKRLQDGKPCPLCGATEHPYSVGQVPAIDETEQSIKALKQQIEQAETLEMAIRQLDQEAQVAVREFTKIESRLQQSRHELETTDAEHKRITREMQELKNRCDAYRAGLSAVMLPYGLSLPERAAMLPDLLNQLAERARQWQSLKLQCQELDRKEQQKQAEHDRLTAVLLTRQEHLDQLQEQYEQQTRRIDQLRSQRSTLYGDKQADQEEQRFNQAAETAMQTEKDARAKLQQVITKIEQADTRIAALQESIALREPQISRLRSQFEDALKHLGLDGEAAFLACRMPESERNRLAKLADELDAREADLKVRKLAVEQELTRERARALTDEPYERVTEQRQTVVAQLQTLHDSIGAIKQKLDDSEAARILAEAKQRQINAQMVECQRWDKLRDLIGSADGKKFRNFAQGLTFERMVAQANRQLAGMSDRYLLIRDEKLPLELNVIDNYQAGEIRSTKNLSGGESFIVSLALALGLSHMASRKVRVDSLFLDEGFGTLDEEALETALETLAGLHQCGKLIGIISHVPALKERIRTQLAINPVSGGKSVITGPGVC